jgi:hypothetical protein
MHESMMIILGKIFDTRSISKLILSVLPTSMNPLDHNNTSSLLLLFHEQVPNYIFISFNSSWNILTNAAPYGLRDPNL